MMSAWHTTEEGCYSLSREILTPMTKIHVDLDERSYDIVIEAGLVHRAGEYLATVLNSKKVALVSDKTVYDLHGTSISNALEKEGFTHTVHTFEPGEKSKTNEVVTNLCREFVESGLDRNSSVVAFGGGVVGDIGGFAAAVFLRGIHYVQIPTTLLAECDSSVGGKVGVNLDSIKNLVGSFYQPKAVFIDPDLLKTLPRRQIVGGLAEVIKAGLIGDAELYNIIFSHLDDIMNLSDMEVVCQIIARSVTVKSKVVSQDEKESGLRQILNFGHTIGHAIEAASGGKILHGEAILNGMRAALWISCGKNVLSESDYEKIENDLRKLEHPVDIDDLDFDTILKFIKKDKKNIDKKLRFVVLDSIGSARLSYEVSDNDMEQAFAFIQNN